MCDYFGFAAGLGWTKVFGNGGRFGSGIPRDTPVSPRGGETSTGSAPPAGQLGGETTDALTFELDQVSGGRSSGSRPMAGG